MFTKISIRAITPILVASVILAGCGGGGGDSSDGPEESQSAYNEGYADGFAQDSEYFAGYDHSFMTVGAGPILYDGDLIPFSDRLTYEAGYWDGLFDAYNDGYFVAYRYAFIIGFSEGYDAAFWSDYLDFLAADVHTEFRHGGFSDGYNDGFSEGRIFGAFDYEALLPFDWVDAFLDWQAGTDLYFEEVDKGTGEFGPVILYEYAENPHNVADVSRTPQPDAQSIRMRMTESMVEGARADGVVPRNESTLEIARPLTASQSDALDTAPTTSARTSRELTITDTWLDRINMAVGVAGDAAERDVNIRKLSPRTR